MVKRALNGIYFSGILAKFTIILINLLYANDARTNCYMDPKYRKHAQSALIAMAELFTICTVTELIM